MMTEGTPSRNRGSLERILIRPTKTKKLPQSTGGQWFVAEQFYTPYTLRHGNGERKFYLFSGAARAVGSRFVAMHVDGGEHEGWRGDWAVVSPDLVTHKVWEWAVVG